MIGEAGFKQDWKAEHQWDVDEEQQLPVVLAFLQGLFFDSHEGVLLHAVFDEFLSELLDLLWGQVVLWQFG